MSELLVVIETSLVGTVVTEKGGRLSLHYDAAWRRSAGAHSLSVNIPFTQSTFPHKAVSPYLWNLLPENPNILQRWAQQYQISPSNPFKMLAYVGEDVPGAAQFVTKEHFEQMQSSRRSMIQWISIDELAERLRQLRSDISAVRRPSDVGRLSLPGAQAKTAFYYDESKKRWGIPSGRTPTTHIVKPCIPRFDGLVENEHFCQSLAARLGLPAARSHVLMLDEPYIVVERYDRLPAPAGTSIRRVHQEDMCQALGLMPGKKYQQEGGPGIAQIVNLLRRVSADPETDVDRFIRANIFNWFIGGTDAHAKNYSILIAAGDEARLAPLYDVSSQLPYPDLIDQRLAMKVGDRYEIARIGAAEWLKLARSVALDEKQLLSSIEAMGRALPDAVVSVRDEAIAAGLSKKVLTALSRQIVAHIKERLAGLALKRSKL